MNRLAIVQPLGFGFAETQKFKLYSVLGLKAKKLRQQCIEAALVGFIQNTALKPGQVLISDRAGQFAIFDHAACWVHMERPLRKIICTSDLVEQELKGVRHAIWELYQTLKEVSLSQVGKEDVHEQYDALVAMRTSSPEINSVIDNFSMYREEILKALDHPGLPLHNNDSERDIRGVAKRCNISGSTKSDLGRKFRDGLQSLKQTCFRIGYNFWDYMQQWFRGDPPDLAELVRSRYQRHNEVMFALKSYGAIAWPFTNTFGSIESPGCSAIGF